MFGWLVQSLATGSFRFFAGTKAAETRTDQMIDFFFFFNVSKLSECGAEVAKTRSAAMSVRRGGGCDECGST